MKHPVFISLYQGSISPAILNESVSDEFEQIIRYLNKATGHWFRVSNISHKLLWANLKANGHTLSEAKHVIDYKINNSDKLDKSKKYLGPKILFDPENFKMYLEIVMIQKSSKEEN